MINKRIVITFLKEQPIEVILKENNNTCQYYIYKKILNTIIITYLF